MAWVAAIPLAVSAVKSFIDSENAKSEDAAMRQAGAAKLAAMRAGAGQIESYRQGLPPQMMQAMRNQMGAYGGAQNALSQMYGTGSPNNMRASAMGDLVHRANIARHAQPGVAMGPASPGTPLGAMGAPHMPPPVQGGPGPSMGFGGEMPSTALSRRRV